MGEKSSDPHEGQTFADRYPQDRGKVIWCAECGSFAPAEVLNWWQLCPDCVQWWRDNPPPDKE